MTGRGAIRVIALLLALAAVAAIAAGCGDKEVVREKPVLVPNGNLSAPVPQRANDSGAVRIAVVTHGPASSPFWAIVRNGAEAAGRQMDVLVSYRAPDVYSFERMQELIDQAIDSRPDGLVVSIPEPGLSVVIRRATQAGIPVVSINSGSNVSRRLGVLAHLGQPERRAGLLAGRRLARSGVRRALCVNQEVSNQGLDDRCRGLAQAMHEAGGVSTVLGIDDMAASTPTRIANAARRHRAQAVLTLNSTGALLALEGVRKAGLAGRVKVATFDLGPDVLNAVLRGQLAFAVDQQPYLQGYLPVVLLSQLARYGLFPARRGLIPTGPNFVTKDNAQQALDLSRRSIR
ncbi:sugar ABC transporter substrate-binding protein [Capillimicrobium parvum]|uniref:sugar ABC transporter substrate-binding protein n=1 Tax=Capillimicrobium parvum TaxID=2884022 RepID=UPI00216AD6B3|nr:sugar ABC transporter substrate-binding protein [Capillimicrobium parvum]